MSVRLIKISNVRDSIGSNQLMLKYFEEFFEKIRYSNWTKPQDITQQFKSADLITCKKGERSRVVFNVGRNRYRMVCGFWFRNNDTVLYIKFVGTHKEYNNIDVCSVDIFKT